MEYIKKVLLLSLITSLALIIYSCEENNVYIESLDVMAIISRYASNNGIEVQKITNGSVIISSSDIIPSVKINDKPMKLRSTYTVLAYSCNLDPSVVAADLTVSAENISGLGSVNIPGSFDYTCGEIDTNNTYYTARRFIEISAKEDIDLTWSKPAHVDFFDVTIYLNITYSFSDSIYRNNLYIDTFITASNFFLAKNKLFPTPVDSIHVVYGYMSVKAVNGPLPFPGSKGNFTGNVTGFFWAYNGTETGLGFKSHQNNIPGKNNIRENEFLNKLKKYLNKKAVNNSPVF